MYFPSSAVVIAVVMKYRKLGARNMRVCPARESTCNLIAAEDGKTAIIYLWPRMTG